MNRSKLLKNVYNLDQTLRNYHDDHLIHILLYGSEKFQFNLNKEIIKLYERYWTFQWKSHLKYLFYLFIYLFIYFFYLLLLLTLLFYCITTSFLTYIYSNFENTFFGLSNLEFFFIESLYTSILYVYSFYSFLFFSLSLSFLSFFYYFFFNLSFSFLILL